MHDTDIHDWKSQRAEQLSKAHGSGISASVTNPSPDGACIVTAPRAGSKEQATVKNLDLSWAQTGAPWPFWKA